MRAAYLSMELVGWFVIVPFSVASLATGLVESLGTEWGLFRYHWVRTKFALTVVATVILVHMRTVSLMAGLAAHMAPLASGDVGMMRTQLVVHAIGGLAVLIAATALSIYKPWGRTAYGERMQVRSPRPTAPKSKFGWLLAGVVLFLLVALAILHMHGTGPRHH